jgi:hypothetical protein
MRLNKMITGKEIWAGRSMTQRVEGSDGNQQGRTHQSTSRRRHEVAGAEGDRQLAEPWNGHQARPAGWRNTKRQVTRAEGQDPQRLTSTRNRPGATVSVLAHVVVRLRTKVSF